MTHVFGSKKNTYVVISVKRILQFSKCYNYKTLNASVPHGRIG